MTNEQKLNANKIAADRVIIAMDPRPAVAPAILHIEGAGYVVGMGNGAPLPGHSRIDTRPFVT